MAETLDIVNLAGGILTKFLKSGPISPNHVTETTEAIFATIDQIIPRPADAAQRYREACEDYLSKVTQARGIPTRAVFGNDVTQTNIVSSSGPGIAEKFDALLPQIRERCDWCAKNYASQANDYFHSQIAELRKSIESFLLSIPVGGTTDKALNRVVADIKREIKYIFRWDRLFYTYKAVSLSSEIEYIFKLEGNPIAAIWHHNPLDGQGEYQKTYDHKELAGRVYAVRGNWALEKGLMCAGPNGYLDEITRPNQDIGCMCWLEWLYSLRGLPHYMMTPKGEAELARVKAAIARL